MNRYVPALLKLTFIFIHFSFFAHLAHQANNWWFYAGCALLPLYFFLPFKTTPLTFKQLVLNVVLFSMSFYVTQTGQLFLTPVEAAVLTTAAFLLIAHLTSNFLREQEALIYAGSFAGMVDMHWITPYSLSIISCIIGGFVFTVLKNSLLGIGGKLGTIGYASLIIWILWQW